MPDRPLLPIKVVLPAEGDVSHPEGAGGSRKQFGEVTPEVRDTLVDQIRSLEIFFSPSFSARPDVPAVGRVVLKRKALAKSHRPSSLLTDQTCPVIGTGKFGDLFVSVQPEGVRRLAQRVATSDSKAGRANISVIDRVEPYTPEDVLGSRSPVLLYEQFERDGELKLKLFRHRNARRDDAVLRAFREEVARLGLAMPEAIRYAEELTVFRVVPQSRDALVELASFVGSQTLSPFPFYSLLRTQSTPIRQADPGEFPPPDPKTPYPLVGLIDSGIAPNDPILSPWVVAREEYPRRSEQDNAHGSFVAGLITHPRRLNHGEETFPETSAMLVDVVALSKQGVREIELLSILEEVVPKYPEVSVWNLSLGTRDPCVDDAFSDLAAALDELQDRYDVTFVVAAGNYTTVPLRSWPPANDLGEADRICAPADSVRALTVGSVAHLKNRLTCVKEGEPSPFTRRGPGPVWLPKPELTHIGGNCNESGAYTQTGVLSFDGRGNVAEDVGTSFATPLVAGLLANVRSALDGASRNLVKALIVHSALLNSRNLSAEQIKYRGFGQPPPLERILTCDPSSVTLVFEPDLSQGDVFAKNDFPIPPCLRTASGAVHGVFAMTLVYDPPLDASFGSEYVRSNVEASLGTYLIGKDGKPHHKSRVPQEPGDVSKLYEEHLVQQGFKWSPVKVYRKEIKRVAGDQWRLLVTVNNRAGEISGTPQTMALLVTMLDPLREAPVYDETVRLMNHQGWATQDLQIQERARIRSTS